jgi:hypothetical protein
MMTQNGQEKKCLTHLLQVLQYAKKNLLLMNVNNMYLTYAHICKNHILEFMALSLLNFKITIAHGFITCTT